MPNNKKMYAIVGNFGLHSGLKGLNVFSYDPETANMELIESVFDDANIGHQSIDAERKIIYATNERSSLKGQYGGGGYLMAIKIDPESGKLTLINEKPTLSESPCYTCLDKTRRFMLVSHHVGFNFVTKIIKREKGFSSVTVFNDTALVLFRINEDGSLGDICDLSLTPGEGVSGPHTISHHHSVMADPTGELFIVCDKGLDQFHTYHLDRANGKLIRLLDTTVETGFVPRYSTFHPNLPVFYANFEEKTVIHAYRYDVATGKLDLINSLPLMLDGRSADIFIHPKGKCLYASIRSSNLISILDVDKAGRISLRENIDCGGNNPRGLYISPDNRFLFTANVDSGNIATFSIGSDGSLHATGTGVKARCPGTMRIIAV